MFDSDEILNAGNSIHKSGTAGCQIRDAWLKLCEYMIPSPGRMIRITSIYDSKHNSFHSKDRAIVPKNQIYESKYEMHDSNYVDLWFEVRATWIELRWFLIRNGRTMTRKTGSSFRNTRFMNRKTGSWFRNTRFMIRITGSLTSSGTVYLTTRIETPDEVLSSHISTTSPRVAFLALGVILLSIWQPWTPWSENT